MAQLDSVLASCLQEHGLRGEAQFGTAGQGGLGRLKRRFLPAGCICSSACQCVGQPQSDSYVLGHCARPLIIVSPCMLQACISLSQQQRPNVLAALLLAVLAGPHHTQLLILTGRGCIRQDRAGAWVQVLAMLGSIKGKKALELGAGIGRFTGSLAAGG